METTALVAHSVSTCPLCIAARPMSFTVGVERSQPARRGRHVAPAVTAEVRASWPEGPEGVGRPLRGDRRRLWAAALEALVACDPLAVERAQRTTVYGRLANTVAAGIAAGAWPTAAWMIACCEEFSATKPARAAAAGARLRLELAG